MMDPESRKRGREGEVEDSQIETSDNSSKRQLVGVSYDHGNNHEDHRDKNWRTRVIAMMKQWVSGTIACPPWECLISHG